MKANEAPEKIYVHRTVHLGLLAASEINITGDDIEYIRKDVFIEKACSWLENNLQGIVGGSIYIEDFRKYIKGKEV